MAALSAARAARLLLLLSRALFASSALQHMPLGMGREGRPAELTRCRSKGATVRLAQPVGQPLGAAPTGWSAARAHVRCGLLSGLKVDKDDGPALEEGQQVKVGAEVTFMHVPGHKEGFAAKGAVGTVLRVYDSPSLSANRQVKVEFAQPKRWIGHFEASELEPLPS